MFYTCARKTKLHDLMQDALVSIETNQTPHILTQSSLAISKIEISMSP